jgi:hypothetical protein
MSADLVLLKEYYDGLGVARVDFNQEGLANLRSDLEEAGEYGLANLISKMTNPEELWEYLGEEE